MKKIFILYLIFSNLISYSQYNQGKIILNNAKELIGLVKITKGDDLKFKENEDSKVIEYDKKEVSKFEFNTNEGVQKYVYAQTVNLNKDNNNNKYPKLLKVIIEGKVSLFEYYTVTYNNIGLTSYYVKKESDIFPIFYYGGGLHRQKFIPFVSEYFKDCETLVDKVKNKELKHNQFEEVVQYYNEKCK
jgi:hypothetical protein